RWNQPRLGSVMDGLLAAPLRRVTRASGLRRMDGLAATLSVLDYAAVFGASGGQARGHSGVSWSGCWRETMPASWAATSGPATCGRSLTPDVHGRAWSARSWTAGASSAARSKAQIATSIFAASHSKVSGVPQALQKPRATLLELWNRLRAPRVQTSWSRATVTSAP